jgi:SAM-dependent methyltransferase
MRRALRETVRPGCVVVDLGAGTGVLGFLALQAGAARVYAIERDPIIRLARSLARENGFEGRTRFIRGDALSVRLPERADVVVSDMVGRLGIDEGMATAVAAARRFLKPQGRFVPQRAELWVAPVHAPELHRRHVMAGSGHGIRLEAFHRLAANTVTPFPGAPRRLLAPLRRACTFDLLRDRVGPRRSRLTFRVPARPIHGLAAVVRLWLSPSVRLDSQSGSHRRPVFMPVYAPVVARSVEVEIVFHDPWNAEWSVAGQRQSALLSSEDVLSRLR